MWKFKGEEFTSEMIGKAFGFIYIIIDEETGKQYIGQKQFWSKKTVQKNNVKKKVKCESDWQTYYSSSEHLQELHKNGNKLSRHILYLIASKGQANYIETMLQMDFRVLENPDIWLNKIMNFRCHHTHVKMHTLIDKDVEYLTTLYNKYNKRGF